MNHDNKSVLEITGKSSQIFDKLFAKLTNKIEETIELITDKEMSYEAKDALSDVINVGGKFLQAKLQKPSLENYKILAEISKEFAIAEEKLASAKKLGAEARSIDIDNTVKEVKSLMELISLVKKIKIIETEDGSNLIIDISNDNE